MPTVDPGALILVTGASGFLGRYIVSALLDAGYRVRITARSAGKIDATRALFPSIEGAVVPDMVERGAYDRAVHGVEGVVHAASPLDGVFAGDPEAYIGPAVAGVQNLAAAVAKSGLKRWVQISSIAAVDDACVPGTVLDESSESIPGALT